MTIYLYLKISASINLKNYEVDKTHYLNIELNYDAGYVFLLVTITGFNGNFKSKYSINTENYVSK